jgi:hypothetical protein
MFHLYILTRIVCSVWLFCILAAASNVLGRRGVAQQPRSLSKCKWHHCEYGCAVFQLLHCMRVVCSVWEFLRPCSNMYSGGPPGSGAAGAQPFRVQVAPL